MFVSLKPINMIGNRESEIIAFIKNKGESSSKEIFEGISTTISYATIKRILLLLIAENLVETKGKGKSTKYLISSAYELVEPVDIEK